VHTHDTFRHKLSLMCKKKKSVEW